MLRFGQFMRQELSAINVSMYGQGVKGHDHIAVPSMVAGKMSIPFCIGLALKTGKIGITSFTEETLKDPDILDLAAKVSIRADEEFASWVPKKRAARVTVTTKDGRSYAFQADYAPDQPQGRKRHADGSRGSL